MATPTASANEKRAALREKIAARRKERQAAKSVKYARLRQVAADEPEAAGEGLAQLADAFGQLAEDVEAFRENLDLVEAPAEAPEEERVEAKNVYAKAFRQLAAENPEALEAAVQEVYQSLNEVTTALENYAVNMGMSMNPDDLTAPEESPIPVEDASHEGIVEEHEEVPVAEEPKEAAVGADAFSSDRDHDGKPKEATSGSDNFVTDRDDKGDAKMPQRVEVPRLAARAAQIAKDAMAVVASFKK